MQHHQEQKKMLHHIQDSIQQHFFQRLIFSQYHGELQQLNKINVRLIELNQSICLSFLYHYQQHDVTKNYPLHEGLQYIEQLIFQCKQVNLFTATHEIQLKQGKKSSRLSTHPLKEAHTTSLQHNREKQRYIQQDREFLKSLGITDAQGQIIPTMSKKWKQINKFIEIISTTLRHPDNSQQFNPLTNKS